MVAPVPAETTIDTSGWLEHQDQFLGIRFKYPVDWFLYPSTTEGYSRTTILASFDLEKAEGVEEKYSDGEMKITFSSTDSIPQNVNSLADFVVENFFPPEVSDMAIEQVQIAQLSGVRFDYTLFGQRETSMYFRRPTDTLFISVTPTGSQLDVVLEQLLATITIQN